MSTTWFKFPVSYFRESRMFALKKKLGPDAVMIPARLWSFEAQQGGSGNLSEYSNEDLAEVLEYKGDPAKLVDALTPCYIDKRKHIVGWEELFALAQSRQSAAKKGAEGRWGKRTPPLAPPSEKTGEKEEIEERRGESHALRDALRDAPRHPQWPEVLPNDLLRKLAEETKRTQEFVACNYPAYRDRKVRYADAFDEAGICGLKDHLRHGKGLLVPAAAKSPPSSAQAEEPAGWKELFPDCDKTWGEMDDFSRAHICNSMERCAADHMDEGP